MKATNRKSLFNRARSKVNEARTLLFATNSEWAPDDVQAEQRWRHAKALTDAAEAHMERGEYEAAYHEAETAINSIEGN